MAVKTINTELLQKMFLAGAANLEAKKEFINELNVFPVPDGDTGTNMTLTIMSAAKEVQCVGESGYGVDCKSNFFRFSAWSKRKLGRYSCPSFCVALQKRSGNIKRLMRRFLATGM